MRTLVLFVTLAFFVGCAPAMNAPASAAPWQTTLQGQQGFQAVSGTAMATVGRGQTTITANLTGATPGSVHPWHVHFGTCGSGGDIVGAAGAYPALQVGSDGRAKATATIDMELQPGQPYYLNVHRSAEDLKTIAACGDLRK